MGDVTLSVRDLRKSIAGKEIIKGISFDLRRGEVFGFLGPNGAGKTTTIRMLVGLIRPTSGSIEICGHDVQRQFTEAMGHLGCIVENPELYPYLTGWENLRHFARMIPGIEKERIQKVVDLVGLGNRIQDRVGTYSLGMRQRLGIAQALLGDPQVLILDEPTNGLDPAGIREMREFIRFLAEKEGLTVLVSSHLLSEIQALCDRVAIMSKGKVLHVETVEQLLSRKAKMLWRLEPADKGLQLLEDRTEALLLEDGMISTPHEEDKIGLWNRQLIAAGIEVKEMRRKIPSLEDLFLELTGGESID